MGAGSTATGAGAGAKARAEEGFEDAGEKDGDGAVAGATSMPEGGGSVADQVELRGMAGAGAGAADGAGACAGDRNICRKLAMGPLREEAADGGCAGASAGACAASEAATTYSIVQAAVACEGQNVPKRCWDDAWPSSFGMFGVICLETGVSALNAIRAKHILLRKRTS